MNIAGAAPRPLRGCRRWVAALLPALFVVGCAGIDAPFSADLRSSSDDVHSCARWFADLDSAIDRADVGDAGAYRIPGYPYLRIDRFTASFASAATGSDAAFVAWLSRLEGLDRTARQAEIANLPDKAQALGIADPADIERLTARCAETLRQRDLAAPGARSELVARAQVPDDYHDWERVVGLYPIVSIPFASGIDTWQAQAKSQFQAIDGHPMAASVVRYAPAASPTDAATVAGIIAGTPRDALGIPQLSQADRATLLATYAPVFRVTTGGPYDQIGPLVWRGGEAPTVDTERPSVYQDLVFTRFDNRALIQLVYTAWFSERPTAGPFDTLGGSLDGVVFRVTLDGEGRPLVYDTIHPCGCFHMFFPTDRVVVRPAAEGQREWAFIPTAAPEALPPQRIVVTTESGTHYVVGVDVDSGEPSTSYALIDYDALRTLPTQGGSRSAFGPDGLVPGTERGERRLFWPMGIESAGAMRQWGHHATAFAGRRHFDSPDLIDRRFELIAAKAIPFDQGHTGWQGLLQRHVVVAADGTRSAVDYAAMQADRAAFDAYLAQISAVSEATFSRWTKDQRLAFLINAYNAFTIELILTRYPDLNSIRDLGSTFSSPWKESFFTLLGSRRSLDEIEHGLIRKPGAFDDPRVHFALVCASVGCPMLRNEAYVAERLDAQLDDGMRRFLADRTRNRYDPAGRRLEVSQIFDWYGGDFAQGHRGFNSVAATLALFAGELADQAADQAAIRAESVPIEFLDYDWRLNDIRSLPGEAGSETTFAQTATAY